MPRIFISHSTKDLEFIRTRLRPLFEELGMAVWCSAMDMRMAAEWERQIRAALAEADWFVVVMYPDAQTSEWVQAETHWALEHKRGRVIPLMLHGCIPEEIHLKLGTLGRLGHTVTKGRGNQHPRHRQRSECLRHGRLAGSIRIKSCRQSVLSTALARR